MRQTILRAALAAAVVLAGIVPGSAQEKYLPAEQLPDLIQCLPAPPDSLSAGFAYDVLRYQWGKAQRADSARVAQVKRDAVWTYEALTEAFSTPFGLHISEQETPKIWRLLVNSLSTIDPIRVAPKAHYHRTRPFAYFHEAPLSAEDETFRHEGSYPSGHTIRSWLVAQLLAEINPAGAEAIYARGWTYGENRVIAGAHWQSDVDRSRAAAGIGYAALHDSPLFLDQMEQAKEEFRALSAGAGASGREAFVKVSDAVPDAILEIRYFSTYNFVGNRIDGYLAPTALLSREAADSLQAVSRDLMRQGYRLKIYDAYRPQCAVDHFVRWAADKKDTRMKTYFYPDLPKGVLFKQDYIMEKSGHTRGSTVDLTLFDMATEKEVDMGGTFDWFGKESHPDFCGNPVTGVYDARQAAREKRGITEQQFRNRMILRQAMLRHGFKPLDSEWWHFTLRNEPFPDTYFNFPVW